MCQLEIEKINGIHFKKAQIRPATDTDLWARISVPTLIVASGIGLYFAWYEPYLLIVEEFFNQHEFTFMNTMTRLLN